MVAQSRGLHLILIWLLVIPLASCAQSTLKVAVCNPGQVPYAIVQANGTLTGYDVGNCLFCPYYFRSHALHSLMCRMPNYNYSIKMRIFKEKRQPLS
jgi:hypothetical protein